MLPLKHFLHSVHSAILVTWARVSSRKKFSFSETMISNEFNYCFGIRADGHGGRGVENIFASDAWTQGNTGNGARLYAFSYRDGQFVQTTVARDMVGEKVVNGRHHCLLERMDVGDLNNDGQQDVVAVDLFDDRVLLFTNTGAEGAPDWQWRAVGPVPRPVDVRLADLDRNGRPDIVVASRLGGLYRISNADGWPVAPLCIPEGWQETRSLVPFYNGDDVRFLASDLKAGEVAHIFRRDGAWTYEVLASGLDRPWHISCIGKDQFVFGSRSGIHRLERHGSRWSCGVIADIPRPRNSGWFEIVGEDIDGDGNLELIGTVMPSGDLDGGLVVLFHWDGQNYRHQILKHDWGKANQVIVCTFAEDERTAIVACSENPVNEVRCWMLQDDNIRANARTVK